MTDNDQVYGYVDVHYLDEPQAGENGQCRVRLTSGQELEVLSGVTTAISSRHAGLRLLEFFENGREGDACERQIIGSVLIFIRTLTAIQDSLQRIEEKLDE